MSPLLKASDVRNIEDSFFSLLVNSPGTKDQKQKYFETINLRIPKTNYDIMWDSLVERYGRAIAGEAILEYVLFIADKRLRELIASSKNGNKINLHERDPSYYYELFYNNGNSRRVAELLFDYMDYDNSILEEPKIKIKSLDRIKIFNQGYEYDVALSFAGEDRKYVKKVAKELKRSKVKVFFDEFEETNLWGKDLYEYLDEIYRKKARYCVIFISKHYAKKAWTTHERKSAQARAFEERKEYILPVRFDSTEIPGIRPTVGYVNANNMVPEKLVSMILKKIET